ncbi:MAG: hypothetical protein ACRDDY_13260 [Clostridium sp.]|uniref:hypothetical protein n=1 Tax=Clostridium sp. TaxID=1506 RepID=UPI003EE7EB31
MITIFVSLVIGIAAFLVGKIVTRKQVDKHGVTKRWLRLSPESRNMVTGYITAREINDARKTKAETRRISKWDC